MVVLTVLVAMVALVSVHHVGLSGQSINEGCNLCFHSQPSKAVTAKCRQFKRVLVVMSDIRRVTFGNFCFANSTVEIPPLFIHFV